MVEHDEQHRYGSEALDVGAEPPVARCGPGFVARRQKAFVDDRRVLWRHPPTFVKSLMLPALGALSPAPLRPPARRATIV